MKAQNKNISANDPLPISLEDALVELDNFPTHDIFREGFIGFINDKEEALQFIRLDFDVWFTDFPKVKDGGYVFSQQIDFPHDTVKKIIVSFAREKNWKNFFAIVRAMPETRRRGPFNTLLLIAFIGLTTLFVLSFILRFFKLL